MQTKKIKILAVDPGTREMGYAYLENEDLIDYGVIYLRRSIKLQDMYIYLSEVMERLSREKQPDVLVLEKNSFSQITQNARLMLAISKIKAIAKKHRIPIYEYAPRTIRKAVCNNGNAKKDDVARTLVTIFRELRYYLDTGKRSTNRYFQNIFDAIACALTHFNNNYKICRKGRD